MARSLWTAVTLAVVALAAGCGGGETTTETEAEGIPAPPAERSAFGRIASLEQDEGRWVMRFDPAWFLSGETANVAAAEDGVIEAGEPVPNDNYVLDESDRLLTYLVADDADVRVLTRAGDQIGTTTLSVAELAAVVDGTSSLGLYEPLDTGVWITYEIDTVSSVTHQYQP